MATKHNDHEIEEADKEDYNPNTDYKVDKRILNYTSHSGELQRAYQISSAIESTPSYTRSRCNYLWENDMLAKEFGAGIVGHPMPPNGKIEVLEGNLDTLLGIVNRYGSHGQYMQALKKNSIEDLRDFIKQNIAIGEGHYLGTRKVFFGPLDETDKL